MRVCRIMGIDVETSCKSLSLSDAVAKCKGPLFDVSLALSTLAFLSVRRDSFLHSSLAFSRCIVVSTSSQTSSNPRDK